MGSHNQSVSPLKKKKKKGRFQSEECTGAFFFAGAAGWQKLWCCHFNLEFGMSGCIQGYIQLIMDIFFSSMNILITFIIN